MNKLSIIVRRNDGIYLLFIRDEYRKQWNFLHIGTFDIIQYWVDLLYINRKYLAYRYY